MMALARVSFKYDKIFLHKSHRSMKDFLEYDRQLILIVTAIQGFSHLKDFS